MEIIINSNVDAAISAMKAAVARAVEEIALQAERDAKIEVTDSVYDTPESPSYRRTGALRNAIHGTTNGVDTAILSDNIEYAAYVEYGTSKMPARPFIKPAIANYVDDYREIAEDHLRNA